MSKKKYQIFISSTFIDLEEERQAAVEAILGSKHIPAGMELFKAGNKSQLDTIKKWIDESDIYMLILGGRYGSIEPETGCSYTEIEYKYAMDKKIPVFAVILSDSFLHKKASERKYEVFEKDNKDKYTNFKEFVMSKIIKEVDDCKDIQIVIKDSIVELEEDYNLSGWVRASDREDSLLISRENERLLKELNDLRDTVSSININRNISEKPVDLNKTIKVKYNYVNSNGDKYTQSVIVKVKDIIRSLGYISYQKSTISNKDFENAIINNHICKSSCSKYSYYNLEPESSAQLLIMLENYKLIAIYDGYDYSECNKIIELTDRGKEIVAGIIL